MTGARSPRELAVRVAATAVGLIVLAVAFVFSLIIFSIALAAGLVVLGYAWWRTRSARPPGGRVIEGESRREVTPRERD
jgi:hypothetical protein